MSSDWHSVKIGGLGKVVTGKTPPSARPESFGSDYPFITPSDIGADTRRVETERYLSMLGKASMPNYLLPEKAVCVVCIGATIGKICMTHTSSFTNQQINSIIVDTRRFDPYFVYYALRRVGPSLLGLASGAATPIINKSSFSDVEIVAPSLPTQRRIASILSAYDDLIENNTRRIAILEEMARRIYEEWFFHFRFPGHEKVKMVESELGMIPEGWKVQRLQDIAAITMGLSPKGDSYNKDGEGVPLVNGPVEFGDRFTKRIKWTTTPTKLCSEGDLIVCVRGSTTGKYVKSDGVYCLGRGVCSISSEWQCFVDQMFIHQLPVLLGQTGGSTFPSWAAPQLKSHQVLVPITDLLSQFENLAAPINAAILNHSRQNQNLRATRDLLLPKLISGEIELPEPSTQTEASYA